MADPVAFNYTPSDLRVPLFYAELNAGTPPYSGVSRSLLIGRMTSGMAVVGTPINISTASPTALFGAGSMLESMAVRARAHNPIGMIYALAIPAPTGSPGTATGSIAFAGTATQAGTLTRYIAGIPFSCGVAIGDVAVTVATNFLAAIKAGYSIFGTHLTAPVAAAIDGTDAYKIDLTAPHAGPEGDMIRLDAGVVGNEVDPAGITTTLVQMSGGTDTISLAAALAYLGDAPFDWIAGPYNTAQNFADAAAFLADSGSGRWSPTVGLGGHYLTSFDGNLAAQTALGATLNDKHTSCFGTYTYPNTPWDWQASLLGVIGQSKNLGAPLSTAREIARPLQTLQLQNLSAPADRGNEWAMADRQSLYSTGIAACIFGANGTPQIDRACTTYQTNAYGVSDSTFMDLETLAISRYVINYMKSRVTSTYPRCILLDANPGGLQGVATVPQITATIVHAYNDLNSAGLVDNPALFAQYLIVARNSDPSRVDAYLPANVASQLRVLATNATIFQELSATVGSGLSS